MFNWFKKKEPKPKITKHNIGETTVFLKLRDGSEKTKTVVGYVKPILNSVLFMTSALVTSDIMNRQEWIRDDEGTYWNRREIVSYVATTKDKFVETQEE